MKIIVILAPGFEEMEAISAIDILRRAQLDVTTVSLLPNQTVLGSHDIPVIADMSLDDVLQKEPHAWCDALILPGGMRGVENMLSDTRLIDLVKALYDAQKSRCRSLRRTACPGQGRYPSRACLHLSSLHF